MRAPHGIAAAALALGSALLFSSGVQAQDASALRARYASLRGPLGSSPFQRPIVLESTQSDTGLKGDIYAIVAQPYSVVGPALQGMDHWCDILILHLNVKSCRAQGAGADSILNLTIGAKFDQPPADAYRLAFNYSVAANTADYLQVLLKADAGPVGTKDYRVVLEATPLSATSSFVHMSYAYAYGSLARIATQGYLATIGRDKVGFSVIGSQADGSPVYIGNVRGIVERNTMRYYLAIEAYLDTTALPAAQQAEGRLRAWFKAVERYPRQLHEMDREEYLSMKRRELAQPSSAAIGVL